MITNTGKTKETTDGGQAESGITNAGKTRDNRWGQAESVITNAGKTTWNTRRGTSRKWDNERWQDSLGHQVGGKPNMGQ